MCLFDLKKKQRRFLLVFYAVLIFVLYVVICQIVPVMLHYLTKLSTVRLYLPKDLRPSDNRFSVGKSIQVCLSLFPLACKLLQCIIRIPCSGCTSTHISRAVKPA